MQRNPVDINQSEADLTTVKFYTGKCSIEMVSWWFRALGLHFKCILAVFESSALLDATEKFAEQSSPERSSKWHTLLLTVGARTFLECQQS